MTAIADTGLLVAALDALDQHHDWGRRTFAGHYPFCVCEPVLTEAAHLLGGADPLLTLMERGALRLSFQLIAHGPRIHELIRKYADQKMSLADACVVVMAEQSERPLVFTVDRADFTLYRIHRGRAVPARFPPAV